MRDTAAYQRWWEGRVLWGAMINASRSLARGATAFLQGEEPARVALRREIVLGQVAYVHTLKAMLRALDPREEPRRWLPEATIDAALSRANPANALLDRVSGALSRAQAGGMLDSIQQTHLERILVAVTDAQGGMERLKRTPLPAQYRFFPALFTRIFCTLLPIGLVETLGWATPVGSTLAALMFIAILRIADDLTDPFANTVHDVPMSAMCRTIEIDLLQTLGDPAPPPLAPENGVLW